MTQYDYQKLTEEISHFKKLAQEKKLPANSERINQLQNIKSDDIPQNPKKVDKLLDGI